MTKAFLLYQLVASASLIQAFLVEQPAARRISRPQTRSAPTLPTSSSTTGSSSWTSCNVPDSCTSLFQSRFDEGDKDESEPKSLQRSEEVNEIDATAGSSNSASETPAPSFPSAQQQRNITATVEKKIRVSKAKAEIDRILKGPDAPFDMEAELSKVVSIAAPIALDLQEEELDVQVSQLEQELYQAVKQQDYASAAASKKEIDQMHIDDCGAVLQVNAAFYRAFSEKDYRSMEALWLQDGTSTCIHPSTKPLVGSKAVLRTWKHMFEAADGSFQRNWMEPVEIRMAVKGASTAVVTCDENVYQRRFVRGQRRQTELINKLTATNIFRKVSGKWYLSHHHASWHADSEVAKQALRGSLAPKNRRAKRRPAGGPSSDSSVNEGIGMDGILGMDSFGPLLGGSSKDKDEGKKPVKRIVMGSLSDILNGNLGDILNDATDDDDDDDDDEDSDEGIISFTRIDEDDDEDDDDELDMVTDDDDDDTEDVDGGTGSEAVSIIKQWAESSDSPATGKTNGDNGSKDAPKDALRQNCISALRKLCEQGSISPKQKRLLLTDIITRSAKGEFSMVEVAYELLCGEGEDKDAAEEEFADQCRVFAHSLPDSPLSPSQQ